MNSVQEGRLTLACGVRVANDVDSPGICRTDNPSVATTLVCMGLPGIETPMDWRSCGLSHAIFFGDVDDIRAMIADGTPSSFAKPAIESVAAPDASVSRPSLSEALCTPIRAPSPANFGSPAAKARKQAEAQTIPCATVVDIFPNLIAAAILAPSSSLPPLEFS